MEDLQKAKLISTRAALLTRAAFTARQINVWSEVSANRRIFAAMMTVGALTCVVKFASTLKEVVVAHQFGVGDALDAFLIAFLLPSVAVNIVAGSFNAALIPTYIQVREQEGKEAAHKLFSSVMVWSAALLLALSIVMGLAAPWALGILGSGFSAEKLALTNKLFLILLPVLPLSGLFLTWAAVLNAGERFALVAITPAMTPLAVMIMISAFGSTWGIYSAAIAMLVGIAIEGFLLAAGLRRQGISPVPRWHGLSASTKQVMKQYAPMIAAGVLMNGTGLVDQAMAAMLGAGSVSVLNYGNKMTAAILGIGSIALSTAVLPQFSRMVAACDWSGVRHTLKTYLRLVLMATVPLALIFVLASRFLVGLLFERGLFTATDTGHVAPVQSLYMFQLPFYITGMLFVRLLSALKANYILMLGTCLSFALNIVLDYVLMNWIGVAGIALSTSIVYAAAFIFLSLSAFSALKKAEAGTLAGLAKSCD
ncbi:MAG: lipid II flippase MurJ [Blastocatellia bacterium]